MEYSSNINDYKFTEGLFQRGVKPELKEVLKCWNQAMQCMTEFEVDRGFVFELKNLLVDEIGKLDDWYCKRLMRLLGTSPSNNDIVAFYHNEEIQCAKIALRYDLMDIWDTYDDGASVLSPHRCMLKVRHFLSDFVGRILTITSGNPTCFSSVSIRDGPPVVSLLKSTFYD